MERVFVPTNIATVSKIRRKIQTTHDSTFCFSFWIPFYLSSTVDDRKAQSESLKHSNQFLASHFFHRLCMTCSISIQEMCGNDLNVIFSQHYSLLGRLTFVSVYCTIEFHFRLFAIVERFVHLASVQCVLYLLHILCCCCCCRCRPLDLYIFQNNVFKYVHVHARVCVCMCFSLENARKWCKLSRFLLLCFFFFLLGFLLWLPLRFLSIFFWSGHYNTQFGYGWSCNFGSISNNLTNLLWWYWGACNSRVDCWIWTEIRHIHRTIDGNESGPISCLSTLCKVSSFFRHFVFSSPFDFIVFNFFLSLWSEDWFFCYH